MELSPLFTYSRTVETWRSAEKEEEEGGEG
jgi:hypothetical protein